MSWSTTGFAITWYLESHFPTFCLAASMAGIVAFTFARAGRIRNVGAAVALLGVVIFSTMLVAGSLDPTHGPRWVKQLLEQPFLMIISVEPTGIRFSLAPLAISSWLLLALVGLYIRSRVMIFASIFWSYFALLALTYTGAGLFGGQMLTVAGSILVTGIYLHLSWTGGKTSV